MEPMDALDRAIKELGGQTALAKAIGKKQGHVWHWRHVAKRVPAEMAGAIEAATEGKITRAELRPDLFDEAAA